MTAAELQAALALPISSDDAATAQAISGAIMAMLPTSPPRFGQAVIAGLALALAEAARRLGQPVIIDVVAGGATRLLREPAARRPESTREINIAAVILSLDPDVRTAAEAWALAAALPVLTACESAEPPLHQIGPLLLSVHVLTGLGLLLGDETFIEIAAANARKALRDGRITTDTFLRS